MFIVKKKIGNEEYYYLRKSERDGDKVRAISVAYLGKGKKEAEKKAEEIIRKVGKDIKGKDERKDRTDPVKDAKRYSDSEFSEFINRD